MIILAKYREVYNEYKKCLSHFNELITVIVNADFILFPYVECFAKFKTNSSVYF